MKKITLLTNETSENHFNIIKNLAKKSEEIIICVAFLKNSGLNHLLKYLPKKSKFIVGTDYYITEPKALHKLLQHGYDLRFIYKKKLTYHTKIYYFRNNSNISIIIGSANLTKGGLRNNIEASVLITDKIDSSFYKDFELNLKSIMSVSEKITSKRTINSYEAEYENYHKKHRKADKEFDNFMKNKFDFTRIDYYVKEYLDEGMAIEFGNREDKMLIAKQLLNDLTKKEINSEKKFLENYQAIVKCFSSSGLLRGKTIYSKKFEKIIAIIKIIQKCNNLDSNKLFAKTISLLKQVDRFGINALTEIMNTFNPENFSVANGRSTESLFRLVISKRYYPNNFNPEKYEEYNNLIKDIATMCSFKNLSQVDHFFSWYYEKHIKKNSQLAKL